MPTPPRQPAEWKPPASKLPEKLISATSTLFAQGFADPRDLEYRQVELAVGSVWGGEGGTVKTHAWAFPIAADAKKTDPRFAVAWSGLVYPAVSVGAPADLQADVKALCDADEQLRAKTEKERGLGSFYRYRQATPEAESVSHTTLTATRACMLIRLGESALAERVWNDWIAGMKANTNDDAIHLNDPYLMLATAWAWTRFDRAVCAHMRGEDRIALLDARALGPMNVAIDGTARERGFKDPNDRGEKPERVFTFLPFLEPVGRLRGDQERRAKEPPRKRALSLGAKAFKTKADYIAALVVDLDQVAARQWGQPGGVSLGSDPIVDELIKQGDEAVEPLIRCIEQDLRLTRSVHFWRDFSMHRSLLGVHEAAYVAVCGILKQSFFGTGSTGDDLTAHGMEGRRAVAAQIRAHWEKFKGVPLADRWYQTLADDKATPADWAQAAANISQPVDVTVSPSSMFGGGWVTTPSRKPGERPPLHGESLRAKKDPSLGDLLARRLQEMVKSASQRDNGSLDRWTFASQLASALAAWDGKGYADALRDYTLQLQQVSDQHGQGYWFTMQIVQILRARQKAGDQRMIEDYLAWLKNLSRAKVDGSSSTMLFEPMWRNANDPAIAAAAEELFNAKGGEWNPVFGNIGSSHQDADLLYSPLLGMPAFRKQVKRMLADHAPAGKVALKEGGAQNIDVNNRWNTGTGYSPADPDAPPVGSTIPFRVCDLWARHIGMAEGTPRCELYWPVEKRDAAIQKLIETLDRYGDRYRYDESDPETHVVAQGHTRMSFPKLEHPATSEDVKSGRAIFTLANEPGAGPASETRVVKLPMRPLRVQWKTLNEHPQQSTSVDAEGKRTVETTYDRTGYVWQAEEVRIDGQWRRFFGFVGSHNIARVPAEEIEVMAPGLESDLGHGIGGVIYPPGVSDTGRINDQRPKVGKPLTATMLLRNSSGLDQTIQARFSGTGKDGKLALAPGIRLRLFVSQGSIGKPSPDRIFFAYDRRADWKELPARPRPAASGDFGSRMLSLAESFVAFQVDLRDWFDIQEPGDYELLVEFDETAGSPFNGKLHRMAFPVMQ